MARRTKWTIFYASLVIGTAIGSLLLAGCGGGGSSDGTPAGGVTFKVNGSAVTMNGRMIVEKYQSGDVLVQLLAGNEGSQWREFAVETSAFRSWPPALPYTLTHEAEGTTGVTLVGTSGRYVGSNGGRSLELTLRIEEIAGNSVRGTFSCVIRPQATSTQIAITEGRFNVPLQVINVISN